MTTNASGERVIVDAGTLVVITATTLPFIKYVALPVCNSMRNFWNEPEVEVDMPVSTSVSTEPVRDTAFQVWELEAIKYTASVGNATAGEVAKAVEINPS